MQAGPCDPRSLKTAEGQPDSPKRENQRRKAGHEEEHSAWRTQPSFLLPSLFSSSLEDVKTVKGSGQQMNSKIALKAPHRI